MVTSKDFSKYSAKFPPFTSGGDPNGVWVAPHIKIRYSPIYNAKILCYNYF